MKHKNLFQAWASAYHTPLKLMFCAGLMLGTTDVSGRNLPVTPSKSDLVFNELSPTWDEGIPLGNATVGSLVWQRASALRFSLDRTDLWDLRPMEARNTEKFSFEWVKQHIRSKNYRPVQQALDAPYDMSPAPSKIPGAAIEFSLEQLGKPENVRLFLNNALCEVSWPGGTTLQTFVHATEPVGWFVFNNLKKDIEPQLIAPRYNQATAGDDNSHAGQDLERLGYKQGEIQRTGNRLVYKQKGWGDFSYEVAVEWVKKGRTLYGVWSVTSSLSDDKAENEVADAIKRGNKKDYRAHIEYWDSFWKQSRITLPDTLLQKQYDNEMYKFASAAREDSYPISLQAVWTADNGKLPPWKGDYHHDLNTQLSYWPTYIGNHLKEGSGYLNTLWNQRDAYKRYTREYFGKNGMNVPGVASLTGEPMGGWIQYSMSQTAGAWLAHHFFLHWKYSADRTFLKERAYPFVRDVAVFLEENTIFNKQGFRTLEFSSSPEINDNSLSAWFPTITNYDLSLMRALFKSAAEMADELDLKGEARHWSEIEKQFPTYDLDETGCLTFAKGYPYNASHRHFSHAMAIHPMGLIDWNDGPEAQRIIKATIKKLDQFGSNYWTGYSFSWLGNMKARAMDGEGAADALRTFAQCFCLKNTFHANGDQTRSGKSLFTYRPFTLEGNFAFAAGIQEMLLQSHTGIIRIFPAIPASWTDVSFADLRAMGAFLVSAERKGGRLASVRITSEKGGKCIIAQPGDLKADKAVSETNGLVEISLKAGETVEFR